MILADTSIWIDHLRSGDSEMERRLSGFDILIHPLIVAELALGSLRKRAQTLAYLDRLPSVRVAQLVEVRGLIESRTLYARGIGLIDAHLIASALLEPAGLWTRDAPLRDVAASLGILARLP